MYYSSLLRIVVFKSIKGIGLLRILTLASAEEIFKNVDDNYKTESFWWLKRIKSITLSVRHIHPMFPSETWDVYQQTLDSRGRTNNITLGVSEQSIFLFIWWHILKYMSTLYQFMSNNTNKTIEVGKYKMIFKNNNHYNIRN